MVRRVGKLRGVWPATPWLLLASLLVGLLAGCGSPVSPEQLEAMSKLQALGARINSKRGGYEVELDETTVADRDLVHLQKIVNLKNVDLTGTRITDAGLEYLKPIKSLEYVILTRTTVTPEAVDELRKALPNADVRK